MNAGHESRADNAARCRGRPQTAAAVLALGLLVAAGVLARDPAGAAGAEAAAAAPVHLSPGAPGGDSDPPATALPPGGQAAGLPDLAERLAACASCHGRHGEGILGGAEFYPHLAGKPAGYLLAQMQAFREGRRHYPRMVYLMQYMDDAWLGEIARWYAAQPPRAVYQRSPRALDMTAARRQRAEQLLFEGDPAQELPACAACHGRDLAGLEPGIPALVGLPADYVVAQFGGWVTGMRRSQEPDCMADIARRTAPADITLVANWLAAQPAQPELRPAAAGSWWLPLPCGPLAAGPAATAAGDGGHGDGGNGGADAVRRGRQ